MNDTSIKTVSKATFTHRQLIFSAFMGLILGVLLVLTILSKVITYFPFDLEITLFIQRINSFWFDSLMRFTSLIGNSLESSIILILLIILGVWRRLRYEALFLAVSFIGSGIISAIMKVLVGRPRPDPELIHQVSRFIYSDSFPSGHVLTTIGLYGFLLYLTYTLIPKGPIRTIPMILLISMITLMGVSRIYLGAHWFSDVIGAYLVGFLWLILVIYLYQKTTPEKPKTL